MQQSNARPLSYILYILSALERARSEQPAAPRAFLGRQVPRREKPDAARGFAVPTCRSRSASVRPRPAGERGEREGQPAAAARREEEEGGRSRAQGRGKDARRGEEVRRGVCRWGGRPPLLLLLRGPTPLEARRRARIRPARRRGRYSPPPPPESAREHLSRRRRRGLAAGSRGGVVAGPAPTTAEPRSGHRSHARRRAGPTSARNRE